MTEHRFGPHAQRDGVLMYAAAAFLFAVGGIVSKTIMRTTLGPLEFAPIRAMFAAVLLIIWVAMTNRNAFRVTRKELPRLALYGMGIFLLTQLLYIVAINNLPVAIGTLLAFMAVIFVAVWNWLRHGRRLDVPTGGAIGLSLLGALLITGLIRGSLSGNITVLGLLAGVGCAVALTGYWIVGASLQRDRDATSLLMWAMVGVVLSWSIIRPFWQLPWELVSDSVPLFVDHGPALPIWAMILFVAAIGTAVPFGLTLASVARIGPQRAGIVGSLEPAFAALVAFVAIGEALDILQLLGGLAILIGIIVMESAALRANQAGADPVAPLGNERERST